MKNFFMLKICKFWKSEKSSGMYNVKINNPMIYHAWQQRRKKKLKEKGDECLMRITNQRTLKTTRG